MQENLTLSELVIFNADNQVYIQAGKPAIIAKYSTQFFKILETEDDRCCCSETDNCPCRFCEALNYVKAQTKAFSYLVDSRDVKRQTILHHTANCNIVRNGLIATVKILSLCKSLKVSHDELYDFVNAKDGKGFTALHYAAEKRNKDLVSVLLRNYSDIDLLNPSSRCEVANLSCERVHKDLAHIFDVHFSVVPDNFDPDNELMWTIECDFGPVIGSYQEYDTVHHQTKNLATWLRRSSTKSADIVLHPMMQIFLHLKGNRYKILRYFSLMYHIMFYISWCIAAYCNAAATNKSIVESRVETLLAKTEVNHWANGDLYKERRKLYAVLETIRTQRRQIFCSNCVDHIIPLSVFLLVLNITKELIEHSLCDERRFYWKQWQKIFQWLLYIPFVGLLFKLDEQILTLYYIVSIFVAMALVQDQLSKTESLRFYSQIFASGLKNVLRIGFAFLPFLTAFTVTFNLLLPFNPEFQLLGYAKVAAMIAGELNYNEVFYPSGLESTYLSYPWFTKLWFFVFVIAITMLFQNLVVACTINDVQKLETDARGKYLTTRFDDIYLIELVVMHAFAQKMFGLLECKNQIMKWLNVGRYDGPNGSTNKRLDEYPEDLRNVIAKWYTERKRISQK